MPAVRQTSSARDVSPSPVSASADALAVEMLRDPVIAPNGQTYDRLALAAHQARTGRFVDGGPPVPDRQLYRDHSVRERLAGLNTRLDDGVPEYLYDPITADVMRDPVVASDGRTYDADTVRELIVQRQGVSPYTRERLDGWVYRSATLRAELTERGLPVTEGDDAMAVDLGEPGRQSAARLRRRRFRNSARGNLALAGLWVGVIGGAAGAAIATAGLATPALMLLTGLVGGSFGGLSGATTGDQMGRAVGGRRVASAVGRVGRGLRRALGRPESRSGDRRRPTSA